MLEQCTKSGKHQDTAPAPHSSSKLLCQFDLCLGVSPPHVHAKCVFVDVFPKHLLLGLGPCFCFLHSTVHLLLDSLQRGSPAPALTSFGRPADQCTLQGSTACPQMHLKGQQAAQCTAEQSRVQLYRHPKCIMCIIDTCRQLHTPFQL